jgi:hypothetical protein
MLAAFIPGVSIFKLKQNTDLSEWRELSVAEVINCRNVKSLRVKDLMSDYDILTKLIKYPGNEAKAMIERMKIQKLEDIKLQVLAQNPQILGIGVSNE